MFCQTGNQTTTKNKRRGGGGGGGGHRPRNTAGKKGRMPVPFAFSPDILNHKVGSNAMAVIREKEKKKKEKKRRKKKRKEKGKHGVSCL